MFEIIPSPEIWHRDDFPILCNWRLLWRAAEIGIDRAEFAAMFLKRWQGNAYYAVDNYAPYPEMDIPRESDYLMAVSRLETHARRVRLIKLSSFEASKRFENESLDFIYIDGSHVYQDVKTDISAWWSKLSPHGIMAGHDWTDQEIHSGVKRAVREFAEALDLTVYLTTVEGYGQETCPSWYIYRSGIPGADWRRC